MSVYKRTSRKTGKSTFHYDFIVKGKRFSGPTGQTTRREAERYVDTHVRPKIADGSYGQREQNVTLDIAAGRWWRDVASHNRTADVIAHRIKIVLRLLGPNTPIDKIKAADVNEAIQARRSEIKDNAAARQGGKAQTKTVSPSTVNRDVIDTLRPILRHAEEVYEARLPRIPWRKLRLKEPPEHVAEFSDEEVAKWGQALGQAERIFLGVALTYGPRFGEMFFPPSAVRWDAGGPRLMLGRYKGRQWRDSRKDGSLHAIPLLEEHARALSALAGRAQAAGLDVIWFDESPSGRLTEITYWGMAARLKAAAKKVGISQPRLLHAMRHHAGTRLLRSTGNLVAAQKVLGHRQITTTQRYAHATDDDIRAGLAKTSRTGSDALQLDSCEVQANQEESGS